MMIEPKSGCPVRGQIEVNSVPVRVISWTSGDGNASAFKASRPCSGPLGLGNGPWAGNLFDCFAISKFTFLNGRRLKRWTSSGHAPAPCHVLPHQTRSVTFDSMPVRKAIVLL